MRERPAQLYLWIWGAMLLVLGIGSLIISPDFSTGDSIKVEHLFGVLDTNGWHGVAGTLAGIVSVTFAGSRRWAPAVAAGVGVFAGIIPAVVFFASGDGSVALGLIPVEFTDAVLLHLVPGIIGVACAAPALLHLRSVPSAR
jgi:low temperature requirement protein LtrA